MTTQTLTCRALYDCDPTFRALVDEWVCERRCPLPLVDRCLDFDLTSAAECARWAATQPDRERFWGTPDGEQTPCGPFPTRAGGKQPKNSAWYWMVSEGRPGFSDTVPYRHVADPSHKGNHRTAADAILWLLDVWRAP